VYVCVDVYAHMCMCILMCVCRSRIEDHLDVDH
jgi:hypothetical protein